MKKLLIIVFLMILLKSIAYADDVKVIGMVTGSSSGTYIQIGKDLSKLAEQVNIKIKVKESGGTLDNIKRMASNENASISIVQSDVLDFLRLSSSPRTQSMLMHLRMVAPLYNEEVHLFARKNITDVRDLEGKRVVLGTRNSGTYVTAENILAKMDITPSEKIYKSPEDGAVDVFSGDADAFFYVAGKPATLFERFEKMPDDVIGNYHLIPLLVDDLKSQYVSSVFTNKDYGWIEESVDAVAVKAIMVSYDFSRRISSYYDLRCNQFGKISKVLRSNFKDLLENGHSKWKEVDLNAVVGDWPRDECFNISSLSTGGASSETQPFPELECIIRGGC